MALDKSVMHNIIHKYSGNDASRCMVCTGEISDSDTMGMEKKCNEILKAQQSYGMMYSEKKNQGIKCGDNLLLHPVFSFGEKAELPKEIMLVPIGKWNTTKYGEVEVTKDMIKEMKQHFDENVRKGVMIDIDHGQSQHGDAAAGWIKKVECRDDGLWGTEIDWTPLGKEQVEGKIYRFLSPEFDTVHVDPENQEKIYDNVLIATSLVNRPLLKEIPALSFSESDKNLTENKMGVMLFVDSTITDSTNQPKMKTLAEILALSKDQRSAEETQFVTEHKDELTDDQKKAEGFEVAAPAAPADGGAAPVDQNISAKEGKVTIEASELDQLKKDAAAGREAAKKIEAQEIATTFKAFEFSESGGKFAPGATDKVIAFATKLSPALRVEFSELLKEFPDKKIFGEIGHDDNGNGSSNNKELTEKIKTYAAEHKLNFREAMDEMRKANPADFKDYIDSKGKN